MKTSRRISTLALAALILGAGLLLGYKSAAPDPAIVATIQFQRLLENLKGRAEVEAELVRWQSELQTELDQRREAIEAIEVERNAAVGEAEKTQLTEQMAMAGLALRHWTELKSRELQTEHALRTENLYIEIIKEVEKLAELQGYDMVFLNDASTQFNVDPQSRVPALLQVRQQISSRKLLYCNKSIDITDELVDRMNNAFAVAQ